ncbi:MAG: leucine--tRNA ligase [bacterium]|nr:leucine--tRNA ligase [bacterium]
MKYDFKKIEKKWQKEWAKGKYKVWHSEDKSKKPKAYVLDMFPYPSGEGLHVGHVEGYTASDIYSRFLRMSGYNVLHPMGWDAFGLPAENYAIKKKIHPSIVVKNNVKNFTRQLNSLGFSYDWQREINTTDPDYYKWTQWIFLQLFKKGLAYEAEIPVNWCPNDKTVLANEEVIDGGCERCGANVERKKLKQWVLKITAYADRLLADLDGLDWPGRVKEMQRNWIGRSEGALIKFPVVCNRPYSGALEIFTTRPDTIAGVAYMVVAPEHPLISELGEHIENLTEVKKYIEKAKNKSDRERQENKEKTGVALKGVRAVNPWSKKEVPIWVSDYVLMNYGTGAIMAVPQHDERDREFAVKFQLPIFDEPLISKDEVVAKVGGQKKINYKLRDWIFSRQRYWGEPIPIIKCATCGNVAVPEDELPVVLPKVKNYEPTGEAESPLAGIEKWVKVKCPQCEGPAKRETNTMPQWAGSCWYYIGYLIAENLKSQTLISKQIQNSKFQNEIKHWLPVDLYLGGVEHAVLHLLYARFWHKVLFDIGAVSTKEPFMKLVNQGLILGPDGLKMSKSKGNVVNPDEIVAGFGADSLRLYEMFMGPLEDAKPWDPRGIVGLHRFLQRVNSLPIIKGASSAELERLLHQTTKKVSEDIKVFHFNTAISALMVLSNKMESLLPEFVKLLAPFAPHLAQELWQRLGNKTLLDNETWPKWDSKLIQEDNFELIVQVNGKMRDKFSTAKGISQSEAEGLALARDGVKKWIAGGQPKKVIFVKDRLINFLV